MLKIKAPLPIFSIVSNVSKLQRSIIRERITTAGFRMMDYGGIPKLLRRFPVLFQLPSSLFGPENCALKNCDGSGNIAKRFFRTGQTLSGNRYFYAKNHLESIVEMSQWKLESFKADYETDVYGKSDKDFRAVLMQDFQFAGYVMSTSGVHCCATDSRFYSSSLAKIQHQ